jgi:uncharacterized protein Usg
LIYSQSCDPLATDPCSDLFCCVCRQNGNPNTGSGYYEYVQDCLNGGIHCVGNTGCRLCYNPVDNGTNLGDRPVCGRFLNINSCLTEACCLDRQNPNPTTGTGYYEYSQDCLDGGLHCIENTGCRLCYNPVVGGGNVGNRPVCDRFRSNGGSEEVTNDTCSDDACCLRRQNPNPNTGTGYYEFTEECLDGGLHCIANTGCRLCYNPVDNGTNVGDRPVCGRFRNIDEVCSNDVCCLDKQTPNPNTGNGYYEFTQDCLDGGLDCVGNTGCRLCYNPVAGGTNLGSRPICVRFSGVNEVCANEACCLDRQTPNPNTGNGYYEFTQDCFNGGLDCVGNTGCKLCYNPVEGGINEGNRTICVRFQI